jgi:uncharacterized UBP type Zn finger protein
MRDLVARLTSRNTGCQHIDQAQDVEPQTSGCEECLASGGRWVHLRMCLSCGHVGCCDQSDGRHARGHYESTGHPIVRSHEPGEEWCWCWVDEVQL